MRFLTCTGLWDPLNICRMQYYSMDGNIVSKFVLFEYLYLAAHDTTVLSTFNSDIIIQTPNPRTIEHNFSNFHLT